MRRISALCLTGMTSLKSKSNLLNAREKKSSNNRIKFKK